MTIIVRAVTYIYSVGQIKFYILIVLIIASFGFITNNLLFFFLTFEFSLVPILILIVG